MRRRFINNRHMIGTFLMDDNMSDPANIVGDIGGDAIMAIRAKIRRCAGKKNGDIMSICYLDEDDSNVFPDGTACASWNNSNMDIFVHFPTFYYKYEYVDEYRFRYYLSPDFVDGSWEEFRECLIGAYKGFAINDKLYSWSNTVPSNQKNFSTYNKSATNRGAGYQLIDYDMHKILPWLFYATYGTRDSRSILGYGRSTSGVLTTGLSNSLGNKDSTSDITNIPSGFADGVSFLGLEDCWGSFDEAVEGVDKRGYFYRITNKLTNDIRDVYGYTTGNSVYLRKMKNGKFLDVLPVEWGWGASKALHYCEYLAISTGTNSAPLAGFRGGTYNSGIASISFWNNSSYAGTSYGARLAYRGDIFVVGDVQEFLSI